MDTRTALLEAAIALASEGGAGAIGLREVARRAGLTHNAPYRHFPSREALVAAVAEEGFRELLGLCVTALAEAGEDPARRFGAVGVTYLAFALRHPGHFRVMYSVEARTGSDAVRAAEAAVFALAVDAVASAQRRGLLAEGDPQELAMHAWSSVHGTAVLTLDGLARWVGLETDPEALGAAVARRVFEGLARR